MDLPTSVTASTGIVMAGIALISFLRSSGLSKPKNGAVTREELNKTIDNKLKNVVYQDTCTAMREGAQAMLDLTQKHMKEKFEALSEQVKEGFKEIKDEIKGLKD